MICHCIFLSRPKSSMSDTSDSGKLKAALSTPTTSAKKDKKESSGSNKEKNKNESDSSRKRSTSGGGKRGVEKRGSAIAAEAAIHAAPIQEEPAPDPGTPTFGGGKNKCILKLKLF